MTGRTFTISLKPAWDKNKIDKFLSEMQGTATIFIINHDKDINEFGETIETHTHVYLDYATPRKITTISNLFGVEPNFIELVKNKKSFLRYLTHKDEDNKFKYEDSEVFTNSSVSYSDIVLGNQLSDKEIADYLMQGRGLELLGVVSSSKLRTIQSFLHFNNSNTQLKEIRALNYKLDIVSRTLKQFEEYATKAVKQFNNNAEMMAIALTKLAGLAGNALDTLVFNSSNVIQKEEVKNND
jgi:hypothetical protein